MKENIKNTVSKRLQKISKYSKVQPKPGEPKWGPASAIVVTLLIYFASQILGGTLLSIYGLLNAWTTKETVDWLEKSISAQFWFVLIAEALTLYFLYLFVKSRRITRQDLGMKRPTLDNLFYAIPAYFIYFAVLIGSFALISAFVPEINLDQNQQVGFDSATGLTLVPVFLSLVLLPAIVEEILVRGFLYGGLRNKMPKIQAAILASLIFGSAHLQLGSGASPLWVASIDTFILSIVLIGLREKTGNIWAGMLVHFAKNFLAFLSLFVLAGRF